MERKYNFWAFLLCLFCLVLSLHSLYAAIYQEWSVAPPIFILLVIAIVAFVSGIIGFKSKRNGLSKLRSWLTVTISFSLSAVLLLGLVVNTFTRELIKTTQSADTDYTINLYTVNGGAATSIGVVGVVDGPLWFKKIIYRDNNMHKADVEWINNHIITINNHTLNLKEGEVFSD